MKAQRPPNLKLRSLLGEAGWTGQELAQFVNAEGARCSLDVRYDRTAVAHWLSGTRPRHQVCELICRAFTEALGRTVGLQEAGFATVNGPVDQGSASPPVHERLRELAESTPMAVRALRRLPYSPLPDLPSSANGPTVESTSGRLDLAHVRVAEELVTLFSYADEVFGGGRVRPGLTAYLSTDIAAHLSTPATPSVSRRLRLAATDLSYLAGFMSFDSSLHGAAQAYFRIAAQLASEVSDRSRYALALRQMSVQAHYLGNARQALHFAQGAAREAECLSPESAAFVLGQEALALAGSGQRHQALERLGQAERLLGQSSGGGGVLGGYHLAAFTYQQAEVLATAGDLPAACGALAYSLRHRPPEERRARMLTTSRLAGFQLTQGHLELACSTWEKFLDDYPHVASARGDAALRGLRTRLRSYQREPVAQRVLARAARQAAPSAERRPSVAAQVPRTRKPAGS